MAQLIEFIGNHLFLSLGFALVLVWLILGEIRNRTSGIGSIGPMEATQLMNHNHAVILDVREDKEITEGTIRGAIHIPLGELSQKLNKLEKYKEKPVIVVCRSGHRSNSACASLRKNGFTQVYNLRGGIMAWQKDSLPLVKS